MRNIRLLVEYDGSAFCGWQRQNGPMTIQQQIEDVLRRVTRENSVVYGAGRTDSGVHARGQVCNFETAHPTDPGRWASILNFFLPPAIRVSHSTEVSPTFHAQRDAVSKVYEYRILNRKHASALDVRALFFPRHLDWTKIKEAMPCFVGEHDFRSFQGAKATVRSTVRRISRFELDESLTGAGIYRFEIEGNGFLKQMVRAMVGTLISVGEGKIPPAKIASILMARDRRLAGPTAAPGGLCLLRVDY